jgi:hypothetical protein
MTEFDVLKNLFSYDWATVFVGWRGVGVYSPWPYDWERFPSLLTKEEILDFCDEKIVNEKEEFQVLTTELIEELCDETHTRCSVLVRLASLCGDLDFVKADVEMRKWRCAYFVQQFDNSGKGKNVVDMVRALEELFVEFGSLGGGPEDMQERAWVTDPSSHYDERQCALRISKCRTWLDSEIAFIGELERTPCTQ